MPSLGLRSLLSAEGIRWLFGTVVDNVATPLLVHLILFTMSWGGMVNSGLWETLRHPSSADSLHRSALRLIIIEVIAIVIGMLLLTAIPHALLLSATGRLFPGSFSSSIGIVIAATLLLCSITFGIKTGRVRTTAHAVELATDYLSYQAPWLAVYMAIAELYASLQFIIPG